MRADLPLSLHADEEVDMATVVLERKDLRDVMIAAERRIGLI
jgi:hypothetical protein